MNPRQTADVEIQHLAAIAACSGGVRKDDGVGAWYWASCGESRYE